MALKHDKPVETYRQIIEEEQMQKESPKISELSPEQQAWLRAR